MATAKRVRKEEGSHRDEMNLIEFPIGIADRRVPLDPVTGLEVIEIRFDTFITDAGTHKEQHWVARGDRGLPRGEDLDYFTAIMTEWGKSDFQNRIISLGSTYGLLKAIGKDATQTKSYRRFYEGIDRLYGLSIETQNAVWDWNAQQRLGEYKGKAEALEKQVLQLMAPKSPEPEAPANPAETPTSDDITPAPTPTSWWRRTFG